MLDSTRSTRPAVARSRFDTAIVRRCTCGGRGAGGAEVGRRGQSEQRPTAVLPDRRRGGREKSSTPAQATFRRFHGTIDVDVPDPIGHFTNIVQNVIEHFSAQYGTEVSIRVDIEARRGEGVEAKTVRVVRDSTTLKFLTAEFEEE